MKPARVRLHNGAPVIFEIEDTGYIRVTHRATVGLIGFDTSPGGFLLGVSEVTELRDALTRALGEMTGKREVVVPVELARELESFYARLSQNTHIKAGGQHRPLWADKAMQVRELLRRVGIGTSPSARPEGNTS